MPLLASLECRTNARGSRKLAIARVDLTCRYWPATPGTKCQGVIRGSFRGGQRLALGVQCLAALPGTQVPPKLDIDRVGPLGVESECGAVAVGRTYLLPPLSSGGASLVRPWLRFHTPLIEPDVRRYRIRLSDKTSRLLACNAVCSV